MSLIRIPVEEGLIREVLVRPQDIIMVTPQLKGGCRIYLDPSLLEVSEFDSSLTLGELQALVK